MVKMLAVVIFTACLAYVTESPIAFWAFVIFLGLFLAYMGIQMLRGG